MKVAVAVLGVVVVAVLAVLAMDWWRGSSQRPQNCGSLLLEPARGDLIDDTGVQTRAWAALADPEADTIGDLGGSRPVLSRSCLLYAGRLGTDADPTVVFVETTVSGYTDMLRIAEVQAGSDTSVRAVTGYAALVGSELRAGVVLPLSGRYLAPADVTGIRVIGIAGGDGASARKLADGVFEIGVAPNRALAPAEQIADIPATLALERTVPTGATLLAVPLEAAPAGPPVRVLRELRLSSTVEGAPVSVAAVTAALPLLYADPRLAVLLDRAPGAPALNVRTGPFAGGHGVVIESAEAGPPAGLPVFSYYVPNGGAAVIVPS